MFKHSTMQYFLKKVEDASGISGGLRTLMAFTEWLLLWQCFPQKSHVCAT